LKTKARREKVDFEKEGACCLLPLYYLKKGENLTKKIESFLACLVLGAEATATQRKK
jgi:hypothetical protein